MNNNMSPWLYQLIHKRPIDTLHDDIKTDIAVLGGGIAGVMTAYQILKTTDKEVALIEAGKVAHGATGHNAGQVVAEFERELHDIANEFGLEKAIQAENHINSAWITIDQMFQDANLTTPFSTFMGYNGYETLDRLMDELKNNAMRQEAGELTHKIFIAENSPWLAQIPELYSDLYSVISHANIMDLLETDNPAYLAAMSLRKGCLNSAMLCEEIVGYLISTYPGRFILAEHAPIHTIELEDDYGVLHNEKYSVTADKVILCTNGFAKFKIVNNAGADIDSLFHHQLHGFIGYMAGYVENLNQQPNSLAYYGERSGIQKHETQLVDPKELEKPGEVPAEGDYYDDPYFYLTRRPYEIEKNEVHNLVCLGGPEIYLTDTTVYDQHGVFDAKMADMMDMFLKNNYRHIPKDELHFKFTWHGLMGFTSNGIRLIGTEPLNPVLLYNLGCNGVGILPSIYGSTRIAEIIAGKEVMPTIFDPKRCGDKAC